jgi:hypothetical protein
VVNINIIWNQVSEFIKVTFNTKVITQLHFYIIKSSNFVRNILKLSICNGDTQNGLTWSHLKCSSSLALCKEYENMIQGIYMWNVNVYITWSLSMCMQVESSGILHSQAAYSCRHAQHDSYPICCSEILQSYQNSSHRHVEQHPLFIWVLKLQNILLQYLLKTVFCMH